MMHVDLVRTIARKALLLAVVLAAAGSAFAGTWGNKSGGVLTEGENWSGGVAPTTTQDATFWDTVSGPVTMTDEKPAATNTIVAIYGDLPLEFALGKGHEYYASTRVSFEHGRQFALASGRFGGAALYAPNSQKGDVEPVQITVDGADAELFGGSFQFGAKGPAGNRLTLQNGGRYSGSLSVGVQNAKCAQNEITVTGAGSVLAAATLNLGQAAGDNVLMVTNGALLTTSGDFNIGTFYSGTATSSNNVLIVADKARAVLPVTFRVGHKPGTASNRVEVLKGAVLDLSRGSLSIGDDGTSNAFCVDAAMAIATNDVAAAKYWRVGTTGERSRFEATNGAKIVLTNVNFVAGYNAPAKDAVVRIVGGSRIELVNESTNATYHYIGQSGSGARLELDNGQWVASKGYLRTGLSVSASNVTISVRNNSLIDVGDKEVIVGDHAEGHVLEVENGTVKASRITMAQSHTAGTDSDLRHDRLLVGGTNSLLRATAAVVLKRDTETVFSIPETGYVNVPVEAPSITLGDRGKVKVVVADKYYGPRRVVLMKSTAAIAKTGVTFETNRGRFDNTDTEIAVVLPRDLGMMVIFR